MITIPITRTAATILGLAVATLLPAQERGGSGPADAYDRHAMSISAADGAVTTLWIANGDTTLTRLIREALAQNHDAAAAQARVRGARAARLRAALDLAPAITAGAGYTRQRVASPVFPGATSSLPDQDLWDAGLLLSWDLDVFGRGRRSLAGQHELVAASQEDTRHVQVSVAAEVASAYFDLRGAQDRLAVARRNAENQRGTLDITLQRLEAGRGTALDSERARAQLSATLAEIPLLEAAIAAAQHRLAVLTARSPDSSESAYGVAGDPARLPVVQVPSGDSVIRRRPDVRSAERHVAASEAFVSAAKSDYLPRVSFGAAAGYTGTTPGSLGEVGTPRYIIGPVISWPALDFTRVRAGVESARAAEQEAEARYRQTMLQARAEIATALVAYRSARERLGHLEESARASERAAELARLRYTEGASDFLQVLDAERTLLEAQDRLAVGRSGATAALVAVYRALGGTPPASVTTPP
jgi:NodT family efflux transporter outer membrane factor (OMF) lipoprotein